MKRIVRAELLDSDHGSTEEIHASLRDLRRINRWFGGIRTTQGLIRQGMRRAGLRHATVLCVGAGDGFSIHEAARHLASDGYDIDVTLLDRSPSHMTNSPVKKRVAGDALALPFAGATFDFVECSLFAHHLEPDELIQFSVEAQRVARQGLLINDLRRGCLHLFLAWCGLPLFRSRITRHDALASIRRAYTPAELQKLLERAGIQCVIDRRWLFRMAASAWKRT